MTLDRDWAAAPEGQAPSMPGTGHQASPEESAALHRELEQASGGLGAARSELEATRQAEAQLAAIVRSSDDAMVSMTTDLVITTWNHGAERLFGYSMAEMVGRKTFLIPGELQEEFDLILQQVRSGQPRTYETRRWRKDGSLVDVAVTLSAMRDPGGALIGYSSVSRDITGRLKAEAELAAARAEREIQADRDRIALDLREQVVQRVFAASLALQGLAARIGAPDVRTGIESVIGELDDAIAELRGAISALHRPAPDRNTPGVRVRVLKMAARSAGELAFTPSVTFSGPVEEVASEEITEHLLAVVGEALSNIARHARASAAELSLSAGEELVLLVNDNGSGMGQVTEGRGLQDMRQRAEDLGGTFSVAERDGGGTRLEWRVPVT